MVMCSGVRGGGEWDKKMKMRACISSVCKETGSRFFHLCRHDAMENPSLANDKANCNPSFVTRIVILSPL